MTLVPDGRLCACGNRGCWEMYASGRALARDARELVAESPVAAARLLALGRFGRRTWTDRSSPAAAAEGDPAASSICTTMGRWLGRGLANLAAVLDPSVFVIGGGVSAAGELLLRPAREEFAHTLTGRGFRPVAASSVPRSGRTRAWSAPRTSRGFGVQAGVRRRVRPARSPRQDEPPCRPCDCCRTTSVRCATTVPRSRGSSPARSRRRLRAGGAAVPALALDVRVAGADQRTGRGGRGRPAAANLILSTLSVDVVSTADVLFSKDPRTASARHGDRRADDCTASPSPSPVRTWTSRPEPRLRHVGELDAAIARHVPPEVPAIVAADVNDRPGSAAWDALTRAAHRRLRARRVGPILTSTARASRTRPSTACSSTRASRSVRRAVTRQRRHRGRERSPARCSSRSNSRT